MSVTINGTNGLTFNDASTQTTAATGFGFKNRIINGAMVIDQRNAGAALNSAASGSYGVDRFVFVKSGSAAFNIQQSAGSVTPPAGFAKYLGFTDGTGATVNAGDYYLIQHKIEGHNFADMAYGTANAATTTLSFWVRSSLTGTFSGSYRTDVSTRTRPFTYTISSANTWEQKSITVTGDTSGTWGTTNNLGLEVNFNLGVGSTFLGTDGVWAGSTYFGATGSVNVAATTGATFYITGVQLEKGSTATSFDYRPYGTELALCQRYFEKSYQQGTSIGSSGTGNTGQTLYIGTGNIVGSGDKLPNTTFMVTKRTAPTVNTWSPNGTANTLANMAGTDLATNSCTPNVANDRSFFAYNATSSVTGSLGCVQFQWSASAEL